jgi:hypothetical protein
MKDEMTIKEARKIAHEAMRKLDEHIDYINSGRILEDLGELKLPYQGIARILASLLQN